MLFGMQPLGARAPHGAHLALVISHDYAKARVLLPRAFALVPHMRGYTKSRCSESGRDALQALTAFLKGAGPNGLFSTL
jgi:hypothetical protein